MLNPDTAKEMLEQAQVENGQARVKQAIAKLPRSLQGTTWNLLGYDEDGKSFKSSDWRTNSEAYEAATQNLETMPEVDRITIFTCLYPKLAPQVEMAWQAQKKFPYQVGGYRRAFRTPNSPQLTLSRRSNWLRRLLYAAQQYEQDVVWFAQWAPYLSSYRQNNALGVLFAATIDACPETGKQVFDILMASAKGEHEIGAMGRHVVQGLLSASRPEGWEMVEKLLIAAQRQEGLRQVILETVDEAHPTAFKRMVHLICEQNLVRFSSVVRAVDVWFGLRWEAANTRTVQRILEQLNDLLHQPEQQRAALESDEPQQIYNALCIAAFSDAEVALTHTKALLQHPKLEHQFVGTYFLALLKLPEAKTLLLPQLNHSDLRIATVAFQALQINHHAHDEVSATLFDRLELAIPHFPAKQKQLEPLVWSWLALTADKQQLADTLVPALAERSYSHLYPYINLMSIHRRSYIISNLIGKDKTGWDEQTRTMIIQLMGDRSQHVRRSAIEVAKKMRLTEPEIEQLEGYLTRQAGDLRRGILGMILAQKSKLIQASADRLLTAKNIKQRQAGLELLHQLEQQKRLTRFVQDTAKQYQQQHPRLNETEQTFLTHILDKQPTPATLDDGLGLFDPKQRSKSIPPKSQARLFQTNPFKVSSAAAACLQGLDDLIHEHRETEITLNTYNGPQTQLLGNIGWGFPEPNKQKALTENLADLPLAEIWHTWWADRSGKYRDDDGFEIFRAIIAFNTQRRRYGILSDEDDRVAKKLTALLYGKIDLSKLRYQSIIKPLLWWMLQIFPPQHSVDFLLNGVEHNFHSLHTAQWVTGREGYTTVLGWLNLARSHRAFNKAEWQPTHYARLWQLLRWLDDFKWAKRLGRPEMEEIVTAYQIGAATEADIYYHLIGPRKSSSNGYYRRGQGFWDLRNLSGYKQQYGTTEWANAPGLQACIAKCRERIIEIEHQRGDIPTAASQPALALRYSGGLTTLVKLLKGFKKENFVRGWTYDGESKKQVFSHLIRSTLPDEQDTPEKFASEIAALVLTEKRLIEVAMYAPQWANHVEHTLQWAKLAEAIWWFHAHTKDNSWRIDQDIQALWQAQMSERTPLSGQDLLDGAVDVAWFQQVYQALGETRWGTLDKAAKYTSGGGGHKRAQLFASAMLGQVDEAEIVERITTKRHQDSVRALGLLPLPEDDTLEATMLRRYELIQEFVRGSRKFGSQRQASEKLAAKVGMENLARIAGYPDPQRLEWAMEGAAIADLAEGPITLTYNEVTLTLAIDSLGEAQLTIEKKGRQLKAVPAKLKKQPDVAELLIRKRKITKQTSRMHQSLEEAMCRGDVFTGAELQQLLTHPILKPMLTQLVFVGDEIIGYPSNDGQQLHGLDNKVSQLHPEQTLRIAHPYDLLTTKMWHLWQAECFRQEYIQPFKQVFRELYVRTTAESDEVTASPRYSGHQVNPKQALALLGQRGWVVRPEEGVGRTFHDAGLTAWLTFDFGFYTPAEVEGLTLETVYFSEKGERKPLPLGEIPPRLFSEVMRDLDLVVSVAHRGGVDPEATASTVEMRAALVRETCQLLKFENVRLKENHVLVDGQLNHYSIHLGSGVVHQQPGGYLCLVPVRSQHRGRIFLPFADDDPKTAEVISKVLLLAQDKAIKDPQILEQILPRAVA